jgi:hypothetical protein
MKERIPLLSVGWRRRDRTRSSFSNFVLDICGNGPVAR